MSDMMSDVMRLVDDPRVASPGDDGLDLHVSGLMVASYTLTATEPLTAQITIEYDTSIAIGWWADPGADRFWPKRISQMSSTFTADDEVTAEAVRRLSLWRAFGWLLAVTAAPGKATLLCAEAAAPNGYRVLAIPRGSCRSRGEPGT